MGKKTEKVERIKDPVFENGKRNKNPPRMFSRLLFFWMAPLFYYGNRRDLEEQDLVPALPIYDSKAVGDRLEKKWLEEQADASVSNRDPSLIKALTRAFFFSFLPGGAMQLIYSSLRTVTPLLFAELLTFWSVDTTMTKETASYYAVAMILAYVVAAFFNHHGNLFCSQFGMKVRIALSSVMFRKIMRMSNGSLGDTAAGKVVNILSNDLQRCELAFLFLHYVWIIPIQISVVCWLGYLQAGFAALIGFVAIIIIALPIQGSVAKIIGMVRGRTAERTDDRIKVMSEVIGGIQVIKMYAWEIPFEKLVNEKRRDEMKQIRFANLLRTAFLGFMIFTERAALFITILTYILFGNTLSANVIYPLKQFMTAVQINITLVLPLVVSFTAELFISLKRVKEFLVQPERTDLSALDEAILSSNLFKNATGSFDKETSVVRPLSYTTKSEDFLAGVKSQRDRRGFRRNSSHPGDFVIEVRDVSASWTSDPNFLALKNVTLRIRKGKLCAIIGSVGSGKSSFLQLLLKELPAATGNVSIFGKISYASQEPWLFPSTVRENILFGLPYQPEKYKRVCKVCVLEKDFKQFPFGDQTLVGERGVSLSGGQRARINLARAMYREADIYLMDDPLSAVDAKVGRQLFEDCINGYLSGHTRILVTHQIHFLKAADFIVVLNEGSVENMGTFDELVSSGKEFSMMLAAIQEEKEKDNDSIVSDISDSKGKLLRGISKASDTDDAPEFEAQKMKEEERQSGNLRWEVISGYFLAGNHLCFVLFAFFMIVLTAVIAAAVDYWVSFWTNQIATYEAEAGPTPVVDPTWNTVMGRFTTYQYVIIHGVLVLLCIIFTNVRVFPFAFMCGASSEKLHNNMFSTMLRGIMRFFDTSSSGRILNRFTKDMGALDDILPRTLLDVLQIYSTLVAIIVLNAIALYWTMIPSLILIIIFALFVRAYLRMAQGVKRLESTTKSPVFGMVSSSLNGIATIRSSGAQNRLIEEFDQHQNLHTSAFNAYLGGGSAFGFYLDTICLVYLAIIIFIFLYLDFGDAVAVGSVGLAVTQSNMLTAMLQHGARMLVEFLAQLTSVERVLEYTKIETESNLFQGQIARPPTWPLDGRIIFQNVSMRYAPDEEPILKNLNINIESGWKVGVVGRTGAGKSSLISALFRFAYLDGKIFIDGIDTALLAKQELRTNISIIPQEPVLFSATIRYNLDPFGIYSDVDIWKALEQVDIKSAVPSLDFKVSEGGSNFSVGQRQLMCLARAILRSNNILIMDEATANVDPQTDNFIQETIRRHFKSCTVITIAHRLNTIMDSDRVLVMDTGTVAEFEHPYILLTDPNSHLLSMVKETGEKSAANLLEIAKNSYFQKNMEEYST